MAESLSSLQTTHDIRAELARDGYSIVRATELTVPPPLQTAWQQLQATYPDLPPDAFTPGDEVYRYRRYDSFTFDPRIGTLTRLPHQSYYQARDINAVTGGIVREFAPLTDAIAANPFLHELIRFDFTQFPLADALYERNWRVDVHLIRVIAAADQQGHPTPEGVHRDGAAYVSVHLAELDNVSGGTVSIYDNTKNLLTRLKLEAVMDAYLFHDAVLWHGVTPIYPATGERGVRSILTFDYHPPAQD